MQTEIFISILRLLLPGVLGTILLALLLSHAQKTHNGTGLNDCFSFSNPMRLCVGAALCIIAALFFSGISQMKAPERRFELCIGIVLLCLLTYILLIVMSANVIFIDGFIVKKTLFGAKKMAIKDIVSVKRNESWQMYVLTDCHARKMRLSYYIVGMDAALKKALLHADWDKSD